MNIVVYVIIVSMCLSMWVSVHWAPLLHSYTYQTNEYWIIIRQIVNSSSNVLSNSTCVFVTWSCYACILYHGFVVVNIRAVAAAVECRIPFAAKCIVAYCIFPLVAPAANNSMTLQSHAFSIQYICILLLFSSKLVRSHAMSARVHTFIYYVNLDTKQLTIFWCIFLSSFFMRFIGSIGMNTGMQQRHFTASSFS